MTDMGNTIFPGHLVAGTYTIIVHNISWNIYAKGGTDINVHSASPITDRKFWMFATSELHTANILTYIKNILVSYLSIYHQNDTVDINSETKIYNKIL